VGDVSTERTERAKAYENRCCDWHWGNSSGRGDRLDECRGVRNPDRRVVVTHAGRLATVRERDIRYLPISEQLIGPGAPVARIGDTVTTAHIPDRFEIADPGPSRYDAEPTESEE
jgi:hypothetical protein